MWRLRTPQAPRVSLWRHFMLLAAPLIAAVFVNIWLSSSALAADAIWDGNTLTYEGKTMAPTTTPPPTPGSPHMFEHIDTTVTPNKATVIYFAGEPQATSTTTATMVSYDVASGVYSNSSPPLAIAVTRNLVGEQGDNHDAVGTTCSSEATQGVGWIICPISNWLADGVDAIYGIVEDFLTVTPVSDTAGGLYQLWDVVRTIANVCFVLAFIVIIYSQLTSIGYSNYNIKDMIPRLIIAAVLVNISFWIAALAVDASNLLGHSIQSILVNIRENYTTSASVSWVEAITYILSGGTIAVASLAAATMGSGFSLAFLAFAALISVAFAALVAFIILAARQAIITMLIIISPLAFVAYVLPNTQSLFDKWRKSFVTMLVFFPLFALVFGGAQLAGAAIITNADGRMHIILIGMATQIAPLIITPLLIRFSTGILGQIANMANDKTRGPLDRLRNWAHDNADMHAAEKSAKWARLADSNSKRRYLNPVAMLGSGMDNRKRRRERRTKNAEDYRNNRADDRWSNELRHGTSRTSQLHRQLYADSHTHHAAAEIHRKALDGQANEHFNKAVKRGRGIDPHTGVNWAQLRAARQEAAITQGVADEYDKAMTNADQLKLKEHITATPQLERLVRKSGVDAKEAGLHQEAIDAKVDKAWANRQQGNKDLRQMRKLRDNNRETAKITEDSMTNADRKEYYTQLTDATSKNDNGYLQVRRLKEQSVADAKHAQFQESELEAAGDRLFRQAFEDGTPGSRKLKTQNVRIEQLKKESATIANTLQKRADAHWEHVSQADDAVRSLRLKEVQATDAQRKTELEWNTLVDNARALGADTPGLSQADATIASSLKNLTQDIAIQESALREAKEAQSSNLAKAYKESEKGDGKLLARAAGIGGREGEIRAYSKAWKQLVGEVGENVDTARTILSDYTRNDLHAVLFDGHEPGDPSKPVSEAVRQAAMYELLQKKGNNQDAQEIRDAIVKKGLLTGKDGRHYEAKRKNGKLVLTKDGYPEIDYDRPVTDPEEIANRRDWQQFFDDAAGKSPHSMVTYSGTDKSNARSGGLVSDMRSGFVRDALGGKFSPEKMLKSDVDELKSLYFDMADPEGYYQNLEDWQKQKVNKALETSILQLQGNENVNAGIDDRNRGMMNEILAKINPAYATGDHQFPVDENKAIIPLDKRGDVTPSDTFEAPITVDDPTSGRRYYTERTIK